MGGHPGPAPMQGRPPTGDARKWRSPAANPQGATARGVPARGAAVSDQPCRLRRGSDGDSAEGDKERARASF
ncbi:hypothetical protein GW17_00055920 [Ensete ventricosum]|nr:hypothetical protein GW17_00055920 [Ensete ventricosum]